MWHRDAKRACQLMPVTLMMVMMMMMIMMMLTCTENDDVCDDNADSLRKTDAHDDDDKDC